MPFPHEAILGLDFFSALVDAFLQITRGLRPLVILGNASTCAEKKSNPRIASWGKDTFLYTQKSQHPDVTLKENQSFVISTS